MLQADKIQLDRIDEQASAIAKHNANLTQCKEQIYSSWKTDFRVRFTHVSTYIEGGQYTRDEVRGLIIFGTPAKSKSELEAWEVEDHSNAWEYVKSRIGVKSLHEYTLNDVLQVHNLLTRRVMASACGKLRDREVWIVFISFTRLAYYFYSGVALELPPCHTPQRRSTPIDA